MSFSDAPAILTQLRSQLVACASWAGSNETIHYPWASGETGTFAVLAVTSTGYSRRFVGVNMPSGTLEITIASTTESAGDLETLAGNVANQIITEVGIEGLTVDEVGEAQTGHDAATEEGGALTTITITLSYGLE